MTPHFQNFQDFIHMNGHGVYVWASYGITFLLIFGLIWYTFAERKKIIRELYQKNIRLTTKQRQKLNQNSPLS